MLALLDADEPEMPVVSVGLAVGLGRTIVATLVPLVLDVVEEPVMLKLPDWA